MTNLIYALIGAIFGYITVAIAHLLHKYFTNKPKKNKRNICMVIGHPGSGALSQTQIDLIARQGYCEIHTRGHIERIDEVVHGLFSQETPVDIFYLYGAIGKAEAEIWQDFLVRLPLRHSHKHPLYHFIPEHHDHIEGTIIKLSRKGDHWALQKLRAKDHKVIY